MVDAASTNVLLFSRFVISVVELRHNKHQTMITMLLAFFTDIQLHLVCNCLLFTIHCTITNKI